MSPDAVAPEGVRENLIETAIKFLQNPKVHKSSFSQQQAFLEKKGLTKEEIAVAVERSGLVNSDLVANNQFADQHYVPAPETKQQQVVSSSWSRIRDFAAAGILVWGSSQVVYKIFWSYMAPYFGLKATEKKSDDLESTNKETLNVLQTLTKVQETLTMIKELLKTQHHDIDRLSEGLLMNNKNKTSETQMVNEVKAELNSLKSLLLNRRQFPPSPLGLGLPSWQLSNTASDVQGESKMLADSNSQELSAGRLLINNNTMSKKYQLNSLTSENEKDATSELTNETSDPSPEGGPAIQTEADNLVPVTEN